MLFDCQPTSGALVDVALYMATSAQKLIDKGSGPYFYLPKMESHLEARLWNEVFVHAQEALGLDRGTVRATVLVETLPAAFQMEEILHALREHSAGLNAGRWDYIFSTIKCFRDRPEFVTPDRDDVKMTVPFMRAYTELLVSTCHRPALSPAACEPSSYRISSISNAAGMVSISTVARTVPCGMFSCSWA